MTGEIQRLASVVNDNDNDDVVTDDVADGGRCDVDDD